MISCLVLDNVCINCIITFYCLLPSFLQIHNSIYVNFLILLLYQAKSHTMDVIIIIIINFNLYKGCMGIFLVKSC